MAFCFSGRIASTIAAIHACLALFFTAPLPIHPPSAVIVSVAVVSESVRRRVYFPGCTLYCPSTNDVAVTPPFVGTHLLSTSASKSNVVVTASFKDDDADGSESLRSLVKSPSHSTRAGSEDAASVSTPRVPSPSVVVSGVLLERKSKTERAILGGVPPLAYDAAAPFSATTNVGLSRPRGKPQPSHDTTTPTEMLPPALSVAADTVYSSLEKAVVHLLYERPCPKGYSTYFATLA